MKKIYLVTALACCALQPTLAQKQEECKPVNLHCDHLINPLGIDNANPRLSWMLNDARQGARQTAYQIIVSTDSLKANNENGEIRIKSLSPIRKRIFNPLPNITGK